MITKLLGNPSPKMVAQIDNEKNKEAEKAEAIEEAARADFGDQWRDFWESVGGDRGDVEVPASDYIDSNSGGHWRW